MAVQKLWGGEGSRGFELPIINLPHFLNYFLAQYRKNNNNNDIPMNFKPLSKLPRSLQRILIWQNLKTEQYLVAETCTFIRIFSTSQQYGARSYRESVISPLQYFLYFIKLMMISMV